MQKQKNEKELVKKESAEVATYNPSDYGLENVESRDILLPRMALVHGTSKAYREKKAKIGEIIDTSSGKILAKEGEVLEIIPLRILPKTWVISAKGGKWLGTEIMKPGEERPYEDENGNRTERTLNFYVLARKTLGGEAQPYFLSFKGSSFKFGQKIINHFAMSAEVKQNPLRKSLKLSVIQRNNDTNSWITIDVSEGTPTTEAEQAEALKWVQKLKGISMTTVTRYEQDGDSGEENTVRDIKPGEVQTGAQF